MALLRVSGYRAVRVTSFWNPGQTRPTEAELSVLRNVAEAAGRHNVRVYATVMHPGSRTTPLTDEARGEFSANAAALVRSVPGIRNVDRRQRAEPQPLLAPAVRRRNRRERRAGRLPQAPRAHLRRAEGGLARPSASTAARSRRAGATAPAACVPPTRRRSSSRSSASRTARAAARRRSWTRSRSTPTPTTRARRPTTAHPAEHDDRDRRLRQARRAPRPGLRRHGAARIEPPHPVRGVRRGVADPGRQGRPLHGRRADDHPAGRRGDPGRFLRAGARARLLPAQRRGHAPLPLARRASARRAGSPASTTSTARRSRASRA